jgi:hypothetical protein
MTFKEKILSVSGIPSGTFREHVQSLGAGGSETVYIAVKDNIEFLVKSDTIKFEVHPDVIEFEVKDIN